MKKLLCSAILLATLALPTVDARTPLSEREVETEVEIQVESTTELRREQQQREERIEKMRRENLGRTNSAERRYENYLRMRDRHERVIALLENKLEKFEEQLAHYEKASARMDRFTARLYEIRVSYLQKLLSHTRAELATELQKQ